MTETLPPYALPQHRAEHPLGKFEVGSRVQYLSETQGTWVNATILKVDEVEGTQGMPIILDVETGQSVPVPVCRLRERPQDGMGSGSGGGATAPSEPALPMSTMMIVEGVGSSDSVASVC
jgi:hypothetical protein